MSSAGTRQQQGSSSLDLESNSKLHFDLDLDKDGEERMGQMTEAFLTESYPFQWDCGGVYQGASC